MKSAIYTVENTVWKLLSSHFPAYKGSFQGVFIHNKRIGNPGTGNSPRLIAGACDTPGNGDCPPSPLF